MSNLREINVSGVSHAYGRRQSLLSVDLQLPIGVTGLLGPNGAGKSTLMKLLATALPVQDGSIRFGDAVLSRSTMSAVRRLIGYLPQRFELMEWASVRHNVAYAAWAHGVDKHHQPEMVEAALRLVGLASRSDSRARSLSGGMRQRLGLACAMVHRPAVLILDEPTVGLDPAQRREVRTMVKEAAQQAIVLLSTHLVEDLTSIADWVVVLHEGQIRFRGSLQDLRVRGEGSAEEYSSSLEAGYHAVLAGSQEV